jgi:4-hydroxy-tetrahydrodipicolinate synthase
MKLLPKGLWPVMISAFKDNNELDLDGIKRITDYYLDSGVNGMFANCLSSEMFQLTEKERLTLTKTVIAQVDGRVPIVATGTFSSDPHQNIEFIKKINDTGTAAVIMITSILAGPDDTEDDLKIHVEKILNGTGNIPLGFYECPAPYKRLLSPGLMKWLAETGRFLYHKDTSCNSIPIRKKLEAIEGTIFGLYNADTPTALDSLDAGARGISPISGNFYSELYRYLLDQYHAHGRTQALDEFNAMLVMMDRITHALYPRSAKVFLQKRGMKIGTATRIPISAMNFDDKARHEALMTIFQSLVKKYDIPLTI